MHKSVLVTGGCGYIGSVLVPILLQRGHKVRVYDKLYFGKEPLKSVESRIELVPGDVRNFDLKVLDGIDGVINLGSLSNDPTAAFDPQANFTINTKGTLLLAQACKERGIDKFTFASTCAVYGFHMEGVADETYTPNVQSDYAKSKLDAEIGLQEMADKGFCPVILRQATVFGLSPRMRWDIVINAFAMHAFKSGRLDVWFGGEAWRPVVHVRDTAEAHIQCLEADPAKVRGQVFNLVYKNYRILELAHRVRRGLAEMGMKVEVDVNYDKEDNRSYRCGGDKLAKVVGFSPAVSVEQGVREIVEIVKQGKYRDFDHPMYYNMRWMMLLREVEDRLKQTGPVL